MLNLHVTWLPFLVMALFNFVLGWLWYSPMLFSKPWAKALKINIGKPKKDAMKRMPYLFAGAIFSSLAISFLLQVLTQSLGAVTFGSGLQIGILAWAGFSLTTSLGTLWEGKPVKVVLINLGNSLVGYAVMGGVLAVWH